jgi:hypothetical protein
MSESAAAATGGAARGHSGVEPAVKQPPSATGSAPATPAPDRRDGWLARWYAADPIRAAAIGLIIVHLAVRAQVGAGGYLVYDDFSLASRALELGLWPDLLTGVYNNHLMPATMLVTWLVTTTWGLSYPAYLVAMLAGQAVLAVAFYRLLRLVLPATWGILIPLAVFLFNPLTLEATTWWAVGGSQLGMLLAMVFALGAQVKYARTERTRHLVSLGGSFVLGLLFFEKSLLVAPLVFLWTACLLVEGGLMRSVIEAVRRFWRSWLVLGVLAGGYVTLYAALAPAGVREAGAGETTTFVREILGSTLLPSFFGGPWTWLDVGDRPPVVATPEVLRWASWIAFLALVIVTVLRRRIAARAWLLLALYTAMTIALLATTRLGSVYSGVAGLAPRYVTDVVLVGALCIGVALFGLASTAAPAQRIDAEPGPWRGATALGLAAALVLLVGSAGWTSARYGDDWKRNLARDYLNTVQSELRVAPRSTVFFDATVPEAVMPALSTPYNLQSHMFQHLNPRPQFVTAAQDPMMFDDFGHIRKARIEGVANRPGPDTGCGYKATGGKSVRVELQKGMYVWQWAIRIAYLASADSPATVYFGGTIARFQVRAGVNQIMLVVGGGGEFIDMTVLDPAVTVCTNEVTVGTARPLP